MGRNYLEPHVDGIRSLAETLKQVRPSLGTLDEARDLLRDKIYMSTISEVEALRIHQAKVDNLALKMTPLPPTRIQKIKAGYLKINPVIRTTFINVLMFGAAYLVYRIYEGVMFI